MIYDSAIVEKVSDALIRASSSLTADHKFALEKVIAAESNENAKWALEQILLNSVTAEKQRSPLCDDTGIPHLVLDLGKNQIVSGKLIDSIYEGVRQGLIQLPGRPMAVEGDEIARLDQSAGLNADPGAVEPAPLLIRRINEDVLKLHVLMLGGGPAIRGMTYRVFHKHSVENIIDEIVNRAIEGTGLLGCTPSTISIGIGRSQYEAASLMMHALVDGDFSEQSTMEREITERVNNSQTGALGLGGRNTVLAAFMKVGPQRASGIRVVSIRPCCMYEPRIAKVYL